MIAHLFEAAPGTWVIPQEPWLRLTTQGHCQLLAEKMSTEQVIQMSFCEARPVELLSAIREAAAQKQGHTQIAAAAPSIVVTITSRGGIQVGDSAGNREVLVLKRSVGRLLWVLEAAGIRLGLEAGTFGDVNSLAAIAGDIHTPPSTWAICDTSGATLTAEGDGYFIMVPSAGPPNWGISLGPRDIHDLWSAMVKSTGASTGEEFKVPGFSGAIVRAVEPSAVVIKAHRNSERVSVSTGRIEGLHAALSTARAYLNHRAQS